MNISLPNVMRSLPLCFKSDNKLNIYIPGIEDPIKINKGFGLWPVKRVVNKRKK